MKVLVTGAAGFIGYYMTKALVEANHEVVGIDNLNDYYDISLKTDRLRQMGVQSESFEYGEVQNSIKYSGYRFLRLDITDEDAVNKLFEKERFQYVCHLAAQAGVRYSIEHPDAYIRSNIGGFFIVLDAAHRCGVKHFVYASSSSVYGANTKVPYSELDPVECPVSLYAATKKSDELISYSYSKIHSLPTTGLRFFTVYGPWGRPDMAPIKFMRSILSEQTIQVYNHGNLFRDFTYIDDIINGMMRILFSCPEGAVPYRIYNIGHSSPISLMEFIHTIEHTVGKEARLEMLDMQPGDVYETFADITALERDFKYKPEVSIAEGIAKLYEWMLSYDVKTPSK